MKKYTELKFAPISKEILEVGQKYSYTIYRHVDERIYGILLKKDELYDEEKNSLWEKESINEIFIDAKDRKKYQQDIQQYISKILDDKNVCMDTKASLIYQIAAETMDDLFQSDVTSEKLTQIDNTVNYAIQLILSEKTALHSMLKVTSYDYYTYTHCIDVATYAIGFGVYLGLDEKYLNLLGKAAMLHDLGKKNVAYEIITKDGSLNTKEFDIIKKHPSYGVEILKNIGETNKLLLNIIEQHHEKCDGTGYPKGLKSVEINDFAKILSICDIFNALTTRRTYKDRMSSYNAFMIMCNEMNNGICNNYLKEFIKFMGCYEDKKALL